jgi:hypothetical protein
MRKFIIFHILVFAIFIISTKSLKANDDYYKSANIVSLKNEMSKHGMYSIGGEFEHSNFFFLNSAISHTYSFTNLEDAHNNETKIFLGVGLSYIFKFQIGKSLAYNKNLIRYKIDIPYPIFKELDIFQFDYKDGIYPTLGIYFEKMIDSEVKNWSYGINFSIILDYD